MTNGIGSGIGAAPILAGRPGKAFLLFCKLRSAAIAVALYTLCLVLFYGYEPQKKKSFQFWQVIICEPLFVRLAQNEAAERVMGFLIKGGCPSLCFAYDSSIF
ncbi:hypothetical protein R3W88_018701 [Solanum pinnatisectum]|uniref:Uncharacterized protein n=1 Tax=Solanum pinnatisectum TaxID=50273 RepID=A0AAV9KHH6_9SOLN|nr:hypothetical protein R3W88_018701 [Solanum pinnatisectum]